MTIYDEHLRKFSVEQIDAAINICIDTYDFFPSISQIKRAIEGLPGPRAKLYLDEPKPSAEEVAKAQAELKKMINKATKPVDRAVKQNPEERKAFLKNQAEKLHADDKSVQK